MTDYENHAEYKISWEECDRILIHTLRYYKKLNSEFGGEHPLDIAYNEKLQKSINFILGYLGEADEV